jgi:hypothetical protein
LHFTNSSFWSTYSHLPNFSQKLADKNFKIIKTNPKHSSLHFKKVKQYWSVRVGIHCQALAVGGVIRFYHFG